MLSGNRNFEARIHPQVRASYLASPPLVVAFALAGTVDIDLTTEPLGTTRTATPVYLKDIWPTQAEVREAMQQAVGPDLFQQEYAEVFEGDEHWQALPLPEQGDLFEWDPNSTYVQEPPYFQGLTREPRAAHRHRGRARAGHARRLDHHRPHLARRLDPEGRAGGGT